MTVGPLVMAFGTAWLALVDAGDGYVLHVLPGLVIFGLGLALMVAPLTATVLAAVPDNRAGVASGINNAVARAGSLLAVAALPVLVGLSGDDYAVPALFSDGYQGRDVAVRGPARGGRADLVAADPDSWPARGAVTPLNPRRRTAAGGAVGRLLTRAAAAVLPPERRQARTRSLFGSYAGRSETLAAKRSPATSTSHVPEANQSGVTASGAVTYANPTAAPRVQP